METLKQFTKNVNYLASISDCVIENCNTHTIPFGYQRRFLSQFTYELLLARIDLVCSLQK